MPSMLAIVISTRPICMKMSKKLAMHWRRKSIQVLLNAKIYLSSPNCGTLTMRQRMLNEHAVGVVLTLDLVTSIYIWCIGQPHFERENHLIGGQWLPMAFMILCKFVQSYLLIRLFDKNDFFYFFVSEFSGEQWHRLLGYMESHGRTCGFGPSKKYRRIQFQ